LAVIKTIDLVGVSTESWQDAADRALAEATRTIRGIQSFDVIEQSATVAKDAVAEYHTAIRIRFRLER
jgi:flavin-binding protein dodecin